MRSFRKVHAAGGKFASLEKAVVEDSLLENVHGLLSTGIMLFLIHNSSSIEAKKKKCVHEGTF